MTNLAQPPDRPADHQAPPLPPHPLTYLPPARAAEYRADVAAEAARRRVAARP